MVRLKGGRHSHTDAAEKFQFHNGTIKRPPTVSDRFVVAYFNSTMVRLKAVGPRGVVVSSVKFQFHNGTIKSPSRAYKMLL